MVFAKSDDKMKKVFFLEDERLMPIVKEIVSSVQETNESVQLQLNIKGYENRKDPKMTKDIVFPHVMRRDPSCAIIGNETIKPIAERLNVPFVLSSDYEGKAKEADREKIITKYKYFILCADYQKSFNLREILKKKRTHFMCPVAEKLPELYENLLNTYRLKVKDWFALSFPVGHCSMPVEHIVENIKYGVQFLADNLKKGPQNIKNCYLKRTTGPNIKVY
ncbi:large subunit ribosomal protein L10Ae [Pancytospora epiphaga]|nr:large subunit ribosomal protein L10Ae [Pancytospora epiphaga]